MKIRSLRRSSREWNKKNYLDPRLVSFLYFFFHHLKIEIFLMDKMRLGSSDIYNTYINTTTERMCVGEEFWFCDYYHSFFCRCCFLRFFFHSSITSSLFYLLTKLELLLFTLSLLCGNCYVLQSHTCYSSQLLWNSWAPSRNGEEARSMWDSFELTFAHTKIFIFILLQFEKVKVSLTSCQPLLCIMLKCLCTCTSFSWSRMRTERKVWRTRQLVATEVSGRNRFSRESREAC